MNLLNYRKKIYSTIGNDGIIEYIFNKINIEKGIFVEFGAWDGIKNSNCRKLFDKGWNGLFIEGDKQKYIDLVNNYKDYNNISCCNKIVDFKNNKFDNIIDLYLKNKNIDFCSIDIDGLDLEIFETFEKYFPSVVCIEGGQMLYPYYKRIKKSLAKRNIQQSLKTMVEAFEKREYKILCSYQDSFFIKKELYNLFDVDTDLIELYFNGLLASYRRLPFINKYLKKVKLKNHIVNRILKISGYKKYGWEKRKIWGNENKDMIKKIINQLREEK